MRQWIYYLGLRTCDCCRRGAWFEHPANHEYLCELCYGNLHPDAR